MSLKTRVSAYTLSVALVWSSGALAQQKAEVLHWWTSAGESAAVKVFADQFTKAGGTWVDNAIAGGANARTAGINRMVGGNPPDHDAVQHRQAVRRAGQQRSAARCRRAGDKPASGARSCRSRSSMRRSATASSTRFRSISTARTGCSTTRKVFADAGLAAAEDFPRADRDRREAEGQGRHPARPRRPARPGSTTCSTPCSSAHGGADLFRQFYGDRKPGRCRRDPKFKEAVELFGKLRGLVDPGSPGPQLERRHRPGDHRQGGHAVQWRLGQGRVHAAGQTPGKEYGCTIVGRQPEAT